MTTKIAITGKSGNGQTSISKGFYKVLREMFPDKSILLFDNDLTGELGHSFGYDIRNTIYGIRSGKHEYKTGIPDGMSKHEFIEWAFEDILVPVDDNTDIIVSWFVGAKDCRCPITSQINDACLKLIERYDFVIFDCEFDLKYLNQLVDTNIDLTLIVANPTIESVKLAKRIAEFSTKHAAGGQLGVIVNKVYNQDLDKIYKTMKDSDLDILGTISFDPKIADGTLNWESDIVIDGLKQLYFRLNLPQENCQ